MNKKRVLYADNDRVHLNTRAEFLEDEGYEVIQASSPEEAEQALERENIHLAILDIRLVEDDDEGDISGILLAKDEHYKRVPKIFVTGFPTFEAVRESYGPLLGGEPIAHAFLAKKEGPEAMIEVVNSAFEKVVGINWDLQIEWDQSGLLNFPYLVLLLESSLERALLDSRSNELQDVFRKLFPHDKQISIVQLNWLRQGCACLTLFCMDEAHAEQAIVIFGRWEAVREQRQQAGQYLAQEPDILAKPEYAESLRYAALAYRLQDTGSGALMTGPAFFREAGDKNVRTALEKLFRLTLHHWHQHERSEIGKADLGALYRQRVGVLLQSESLEDARCRLQAALEAARSRSLVKEASLEDGRLAVIFQNGTAFQGPDPLAVLFDPEAFERQPALIGSTFGGIAPGALLIDPEGQVYPSEMSALTRSPLLEDFISIECGFHFDGMSSTELLNLCEFERQLGEANSLNELLPASSVEPEYRRAWLAIQTIRKLAAETAGEALEPYLIGLFHYALKPLLRYDPQRRLPSHQLAQLVHRALAAATILEHLRRLRAGKEDPSSGGGEISGLKIEEASREVSVDGRDIRLTQTEFRLLAHLYKNPNRLCSREEILAEVFDIKGAPSVSDKGMLNTHIDRLRKKIDINPAKHRYLVTIRGEGYLLDLKP